MSQQTSGKLRDMTRMALLVALLAVCAWITLSFGPLVFTMQIFGIFTTLGLMGGRRGTITIAVYLAAGCIGLPVFSGFNGGAGALLGATGGYLLGFLATAGVYWLITARFGTTRKVMIAGMLLGLLACYAVGTAWFILVYAGGGKSLLSVLSLCVFPYVLPDLIKMGLALLVTDRVSRVISL